MCESFKQIGTKRLMCGANLHHPPFLYQSLELPVPHSWKLPGYNSGLIALWTNRRRSEAVVSSSSVLWNQPCSWHRSEAATWLQNTPSGFSNYKKKKCGEMFYWHQPHIYQMSLWSVWMFNKSKNYIAVHPSSFMWLGNKSNNWLSFYLLLLVEEFAYHFMLFSSICWLSWGENFQHAPSIHRKTDAGLFKAPLI